MHRFKEEHKTGRCLDYTQYNQRAAKLTQIEDDYIQTIESTFSKKKAELNVSLRRTSTVQSKDNNARESIFSGLAPALFFGQCLSLLGVSHLSRNNGSRPVFRWKSPRILFSIVLSVLLAIHVIFIITYNISRRKMPLHATQTLAFYICGFLTSCLFMRLTSRWTSLWAAFEKMEKQVGFYGNFSGLKKQMKRITAVVLSSILVEKILYEISVVTTIKKLHSSDRYERDWFKLYYSTHFESVATYVPFASVSLVGVILINLASLLITAYNDLFIMLISVAISWLFRVLNKCLLAESHEDKDARSWKRARETYNDLCLFVRVVDSSLSCHILLSFVINCTLVGLQLLHSVSTKECSLNEHIYLTYSFGFMSIRAVGVCICAASVHEQSRTIRRVLFSVSSKSYCVEVERFTEQVTSDEVALTGCNFFNVTRTLLLRVIGTMTTYSVVLFQINGIQAGSTANT